MKTAPGSTALAAHESTRYCASLELSAVSNIVWSNRRGHTTVLLRVLEGTYLYNYAAATGAACRLVDAMYSVPRART